ncbi:MAG: hypothetical protein Q9M32_01040 [Sulfurimonas sp.]|nr:hypothetical protein [Sulfurimonas sp.]MDQ7059772.1 hypothetical protein [Sulfurimonas sp.]
MKKLLLLFLLFISSLYANKVLYLSYVNVPDRIIKGEVFSITIKTIATVPNFDGISYTFKNRRGLRVLNVVPYRQKKGRVFLETFKFIATRNAARLPDITASIDARRAYETTTLSGKKLNVIALNPKKDYSNIIADSLELQDYKTTSFDTKHNIIVFTALAQNSNLQTIKFQNVFKQGVESINKKSFIKPKVTYFIVVNKDLEKFSFTYFNLQTNRFTKLTIPIILDDDSVTTQTDLKPKDQSKERLKMNIAAGVALSILFFALWRRKFIYIVLIFFPLVYVIYFAMPSEDICIKQGSSIHLLPVHNGTIFETTSEVYTLSKEGSVKDFTKVKLKNKKIGWVKNEDLCAP